MSLRSWPALGVCVALACNSDDPYGLTGDTSTAAASTTTGAEDPTTGDATTGTSTGAPDPTTTTTGETTGEPPPEQTCRDVLMCVGMCALSLDLECFQECTQGLPPEEGMKALALGGCIVQGCFASGACTPETLQDPLCFACLGVGLLGGSAEGCEEQSEACQ